MFTSSRKPGKTLGGSTGQGDWRFAALGVRPTNNSYIVERAYWDLVHKYGPVANSDPEAAKRLELINRAYYSLGVHNEEPFTARETGSRPTLRALQRDRFSDLALTLMLVLLIAGAGILAISDGARSQANLLLNHAVAVLTHMI